MTELMRTKSAMMLSHIVITLFFCFLPTSSYAGGSWNGWIYQDHYPTSNTLLAVKFVTPKKGWVFGDAGTILHTDDGGHTWEAQESGTEQPLISIAMINDKVGWGVGHLGCIIHTSDGKTWTKQLEANAYLNSIYFLNDKEGWAAGNKMPTEGRSGGALFHTVDGGQRWEEIVLAIPQNIAAVYFINNQTGWLLAGGDIYRTKDGGQKWDRSNLSIKRSMSSSDLPIGSFFSMTDWTRGDIVFKDERIGWAVVGGGDVYYTNDGGNEWSQQYFSPNDNLQRLYLDEERVCAIGNSIICSVDGKVWNKIYDAKYDFDWLSPDYRTIQIWIGGIQFGKQGEGWAVGADGLIMNTEDGGRKWNFNNTVLGKSHFINKKTAWASRYDKDRDATYILQTEDGGETWKIKREFKESITFKSYGMLPSGKQVVMDETAPLHTGFNKIFVLDDKRVWFAGHKIYNNHLGGNLVRSFILHTPDGGETWKQEFELTHQHGGDLSGDIGDLFFLNSSTGWASGSSGLILHTVDGGKTWQQQNSGTNIYLTKILFADAKKGWAIGGNIAPGGCSDSESKAQGIVLSTSDGGAHWTVQWQKTEVALGSLSLMDQKTAWVHGDTESGALTLSTKNGGKRWRELTGEQGLKGAPCWLDKKRGWIRIDERTFQITSDGGKIWKKVKVQPRRYSWHIAELF